MNAGPIFTGYDGHLLIAFAGAKQSVEVLKIKLSDLSELQQ